MNLGEPSKSVPFLASSRVRLILLALGVLLLVALIALDLYRADQCREAGCSAYNYLTFQCTFFDCIK